MRRALELVLIESKLKLWSGKYGVTAESKFMIEASYDRFFSQPRSSNGKRFAALISRTCLEQISHRQLHYLLSPANMPTFI